MSNTLNGNDLQQIQEESGGITSDLDRINYVAGTSLQADIADYQGVMNTIIIRGRAVFDTKAELANWVTAIRALQNGDQKTVIYHSDLEDEATSGNYQNGNFNVKVKSFDWNYKAGDVLEVNYTLVLWEGYDDSGD